MSRIMILGATGSLGKHVTAQAIAAGHDVSVLVRTPAKLSADPRDRLQPGSATSLYRNGLALPIGMRGTKAE